MGIQISHDDAVVTEDKKKVKIGETAGDSGNVNVMNVDRDIVNGGFSG